MLYLEEKAGHVQLQVRKLSPFWSPQLRWGFFLALVLHVLVLWTFPITHTKLEEVALLPEIEVELFLVEEPAPIACELDERGRLLHKLLPPPASSSCPLLPLPRAQ